MYLILYFPAADKIHGITCENTYIHTEMHIYTHIYTHFECETVTCMKKRSTNE